MESSDWTTHANDEQKESWGSLFWFLLKLFFELERAFERREEFMEHMNNSQIELLKAIRTLIDGRIEYLEQQRERKKARREAGMKRAVKIDVE